MKKEEYIKESIKIEMDFFKVFVYILIVLGAGDYVLLTQLNTGRIYVTLFYIGIIFLGFFTILAVRGFFIIKKHQSKLKQTQ